MLIRPLTLVTVITLVAGCRGAARPLPPVPFGEASAVLVMQADSLAATSKAHAWSTGKSLGRAVHPPPQCERRSPAYILDGERLPAGTPARDSSTAARLAALSPGEISDLTVIKSTAAVGRFGPEATCGAVLITTRRGAPSVQRETESRPPAA
jgi:hypothetical protein